MYLLNLSNYYEDLSMNPSWADERLVETAKAGLTFLLLLFKQDNLPICGAEIHDMALTFLNRVR